MEQNHNGHGQTQGDVAYDEQEAGSEKGVCSLLIEREQIYGKRYDPGFLAQKSRLATISSPISSSYA